MDSMKLLSKSNNDNVYKFNTNEKKSKPKNQLHHLSNLLLNPTKDITITYTSTQEQIMDRTSTNANCKNDDIQSQITCSQSYNTNSYNDSFSCSYSNHDKSCMDDGNSTKHHDCIKILIKQTIKKLVRVVYTGQLLPSTTTSTSLSSSSCTHTNSTNLQTNLLSLVHSITTSYNQSLTNITTLQNQNKTLQKQLNGWKDTATKLDNEWQDEKDETLANFLVLYNQMKKDYRSVKEELKSEKKKNLLLMEKLQTHQKQQSTGLHHCNSNNRGKGKFRTKEDLGEKFRKDMHNFNKWKVNN